MIIDYYIMYLLDRNRIILNYYLTKKKHLLDCSIHFIDFKYISCLKTTYKIIYNLLLFNCVIVQKIVGAVGGCHKNTHFLFILYFIFAYTIHLFKNKHIQTGTYTIYKPYQQNLQSLTKIMYTYIILVYFLNSFLLILQEDSVP